MVEDVSTTEELFEKLEKVTPDVVMLEMDIPDINGIAALRKIKKEYPDVKVLTVQWTIRRCLCIKCHTSRCVWLLGQIFRYRLHYFGRKKSQ